MFPDCIFKMWRKEQDMYEIFLSMSLWIKAAALKKLSDATIPEVTVANQKSKILAALLGEAISKAEVAPTILLNPCKHLDLPSENAAVLQLRDDNEGSKNAIAFFAMSSESKDQAVF